VEVQVGGVTVAEYIYDGDATERHRATSVVCKGS